MFSSKVISWLAAVAAACFLLVVLLQVLEFTYYRSAPSVWPVQ